MVQRYDLAKFNFPNLGKTTKSPHISSIGKSQEARVPPGDVHSGLERGAHLFSVGSRYFLREPDSACGAEPPCVYGAADARCAGRAVSGKEGGGEEKEPMVHPMHHVTLV